MFDYHKEYNLRKTAFVKNKYTNKTKEIIPRLPTSYGWIEVDLSVADSYNEYLRYLDIHSMKLIDTYTRKVPTFKTRILLLIEKIVLYIVGGNENA